MRCLIRSQVQNVARHAFAELVERASACDRIRGVLALIKRHENLFRLPTRIRHATERGLYDQVMPQHGHAQEDCQPIGISIYWKSPTVQGSLCH